MVSMVSKLVARIQEVLFDVSQTHLLSSTNDEAAESKQAGRLRLLDYTSINECVLISVGDSSTIAVLDLLPQAFSYSAVGDQVNRYIREGRKEISGLSALALFDSVDGSRILKIDLGEINVLPRHKAMR